MDNSERTVQSVPFFRPNIPLLRQTVKRIADAILAAMAWMVAEWLWFEPEQRFSRKTAA